MVGSRTLFGGAGTPVGNSRSNPADTLTVNIMSRWRVELRRSGKVAVVDLIDAIGPLNDWRCNTDGALSPDSGSFTNQTRRIVPTVQPSWVLEDFDIDDATVGKTGHGNMDDNDGNFPEGPFTYRVTLKL